MEQPNGAARPPIEYPQYLIHGKSYIAKFGMGAKFRLEQMGLTLSSLKEEVEAWQKAGRNMSLTLTLAAAMLGTEDADGVFIPIRLTPEQIADALPDNEALTQLANTLTSAFAKVKPAETPTAQTQSAPAVEPKPS